MVLEGINCFQWKITCWGGGHIENVPIF